MPSQYLYQSNSIWIWLSTLWVHSLQITIPAAAETPKFNLTISDRLQSDDLVASALYVLQDAVSREGWIWSLNGPANQSGFSGQVELDPIKPVKHPDEYEFESSPIDKTNFIQWTIRCGTVRGAVAGLHWLADRIYTQGIMPSDVSRLFRPVFERHFMFFPEPGSLLRSGKSSEVSKDYERIRVMLRKSALYGATDLIMWDRNNVTWIGSATPPESLSTTHEVYRNVIQMAHEYGMRVWLFGDELIYRPEWLEAAQATLDTQNPHLWELLKEKIRNVFRALPETDGIAVRTGEVIPRDDFSAFDLVHHRSERETRSIEFIYQQIVKSIYDVTVGEFGKEYLQRTWVTSLHEQHSIVDVYRAIFNDAIPTHNLTVSIKLTRTDQWQFQQLNPTFGQSPHRTNVEVETARFARHGAPIYDFAAERVASGMQYALHRGASSVSHNSEFDATPPLLAAYYLVWRFSWDPNQDVREVVHDWCARTFGREHAHEIADTLMALDNAVRNAWYVHSQAVTGWNPLQHIYVDRFVCKGNPIYDRGAGHDKFLYELYLQSKPWLTETLAEMDYGIELWRKARDRFLGIQDQLLDRPSTEFIARDLVRGIYALQLNRAYMAAVFACYAFRDNPTQEREESLRQCIVELQQALDEHAAHEPFFGTYAIELFLDIAKRTSENPESAKAYLDAAPSDAEIQAAIAVTAQNELNLLQQHPEAVCVYRWQATVDGRDVIHVSPQQSHIEHFSADPISRVREEFLSDFLEQGRYVLKRLRGRGLMALLEPPTEQNYGTARIYVDDPMTGSDVYEVELWVIP